MVQIVRNTKTCPTNKPADDNPNKVYSVADHLTQGHTDNDVYDTLNRSQPEAEHTYEVAQNQKQIRSNDDKKEAHNYAQLIDRNRWLIQSSEACSPRQICPRTHLTVDGTTSAAVLRI